MGWLIDEILNELFDRIVRGIYRSVGWVGCLMLSLVTIAMIALILLLVVW